MNKNLKNLLLILLILVIGWMFFTMNQTDKKAGKVHEITYSQFLDLLDPNVESKNKVGELYSDTNADINLRKQLTIEKETIDGWYIPKGFKDPVRFKTAIAPVHPDLTNKIKSSGLQFQARNVEESKFYNIMTNIVTWLLIIGVFWFIVMKLQSTGNKAFSFGKSRAKMSVDPKVKVSFLDVAGCDEAKQELTEIIDFLKEPKKFQAIGARIPTGVLLVGPPGTGKTLLARAVAGEAGVPFFSISGSDFVEMFVGVGASRVRDLFEQGKRNAPCIIFIDEIDAVGRLRGAGLGGGHDEREQTLNQMLVEMDGFEENDGVIVVAATNRPDVLDPALLRPGRFDRQIVVDLPDIKGREEILKVHTKKVPLTSEISLGLIAKGTPGFTGADLSNLINEAALLAARRNKKRVTQSELEEARDKVLMGPERRTRLISDKEKKITAYHEAGHALLGCLLPHTDPVHKATIIPRGRALGLTQSLPNEEKLSYDRYYCLDRIVMTMGGYIAEELMFGSPSNGSSNDIQQATNIARRMVCEWGMSEKLGTVNYNPANEQVFVGRDMHAGTKYYSEEFAALIDSEVREIIQSSLDKGRNLIRQYKEQLEEIANLLLENETAVKEELEAIVSRLPLPERLDPIAVSIDNKKAVTKPKKKQQLKPALS
jgi:cell division protease FtsH